MEVSTPFFRRGGRPTVLGVPQKAIGKKGYGIIYSQIPNLTESRSFQENALPQLVKNQEMVIFSSWHDYQYSQFKSTDFVFAAAEELAAGTQMLV